MKTSLENPWQKQHKKKLIEKQNFFIGRIDTYRTILKGCYATVWHNFILILHVVLGIQTCRCHWKINCKQLRRRSHTGLNHFEKTNLLPVKNRVDQCITVTAYNFKNNLSPVYMSDIYPLNSSPVVKTRRSVDSVIEPIYVKKISWKSVSYLGPQIWNGLDKNIKTSTSMNSFKPTLKQFLEN